MKKYILTVILTLGLGATPYVAANEVNPQLAQCQELQGEATRSLMKSCVAHIGCEFALKRKNSCSDAAKFIGKLKAGMAGGKKITNEIVFEAALPELIPSDALERKIAAVREVLQAKKLGQQQGVEHFVDETGKIPAYYYEGGLKDGKPHGIGIRISSIGVLRYGEFVNSIFTGIGWAYRDSNGVMYVGDFFENLPHGHVAFQSSKGTVKVGNFYEKNNSWQGLVNVVTKEGTYVKQVFDNNGKEIGQYPGSMYDQEVLRLANSKQKKKAEADAIGARYDQRISAASEACRSDLSNCRTGCATEALIHALGKTGNTAANLNCLNNCEKDNDRCQEQPKALEREKRQAVAAAQAPPPAAPATAPSASASTGGRASTGASTGAAVGKSVASSESKENMRVGKSCKELYDELNSSLEDIQFKKHNASAGKTLLMAGRYGDQDLWKKHFLLRFVNMHPSCEDDRSTKELAALAVKLAQGWCRQHGHNLPSGIHMTNCDSGIDLAGVATDAEALVNKLVNDEINARNRQVTSERKHTGDVEKSEAACRVTLDSLVAQHKAAELQIPKNSIVVRSEASMWLITKSAEVIMAKCPESRKYAAQVDYERKMYKEFQRVCDATANAPPCKPRLPGKEPVAPTPVASKPLPPVSSKSEGACGRPPSASAVKCLEEKCAKEGGELKPADQGCYVCRNYGRKWFACPDGRDAAQ